MANGRSASWWLDNRGAIGSIRRTLLVFAETIAMRASLLLSILVLILPAASAQDYLAGEPIWLQHSICAVPQPCIATDTYNYYLAGDSVIQGVTWKKVVREGQISYMWQSTPPVGPGCVGTSPYGPEFNGVWLIRQQDRQLRIWVNDMDVLLHEFDLQVGQAVPLSYTNWNSEITVAAIDYVQVGGEMRARYELEDSWAQYLIEGVGSSNGLFEPLSNFLECGYGLDCFGLANVSYYPTEWEGSCWVVMGIRTQVEEPVVALSPNPASGELMLQGTRAGDRISIRDAVGREVIATRSASDRASIDVSGLPEGAYSLVTGRSVLRLLIAR